MGMAITLQEYLSDIGVAYEVLTHPHRISSSRVAQSAAISGECLAKGVLLQDDAGYLLAVLPSTRRVDLEKIQTLLGRPVDMASEEDLEDLFPDCDPGAVPPVGAAYGMPVVIDDSLVGRKDIYFEAGDHRCLVHVAGPEFGRVMRGAEHGKFSDHI